MDSSATSEPHAAEAKPKRRWFQLSLRTLLVVVALCAVASSWVVVKIQQAKRLRERLREEEKQQTENTKNNFSVDWVRTRGSAP